MSLRILDRIVTDDGLRLVVGWLDETIYLSFPPDAEIQKRVLLALQESETLSEWMKKLEKMGMTVDVFDGTGG